MTRKSEYTQASEAIIILMLLTPEFKLNFNRTILIFTIFPAGGGPGEGPGVEEVVLGGHRPALHRAPRLLLPQRDPPHEEASPQSSQNFRHRLR